MDEKTLCDYGCGREALYTLKNGKHCCSEHYNQCPAIRSKNSKGLIKAKEEGRGPWGKENSWSGSDKNKQVLYEAMQRNVQKKMEEAFVEHSKVSNEAINNYLINYKHWDHKCSRCGLSEWQGQEIPLELHHKNGNSSDNRIENLEYLCLNCHALTDSFRGRNINNGRIKVSDSELERALVENDSVRKALISVGLAPKGGNYIRAYKILGKIKDGRKEGFQ